MGNMNLGQFQAAVLGALDSLRAEHPRVVAGEHTRCINDAAADIVRIFPDRFPEHQDQTWTNGPTTVGNHLIALPEDLLVLERVTHSEGETITLGNWSSIEESIVSHSKVETIGLLNKAADVADYPTLWDRKGTALHYYPTTRTGFTTTFRLYGTSREAPLTAPGATFRMDRDFDQVIVLLAASKLARIVGYMDRARELELDAKRIVGEGISVTLHEAGASYLEPCVTFDGWRN